MILDDELEIANALASIAGNQLEEFAGTLVNIFAMQNRVIDFIKRVCCQEIQNTDSAYIIFRGNSLSTKVVDVYMKMIGLDYLKSVLTDAVQKVYKDDESCEVGIFKILKIMAVHIKNHKKKKKIDPMKLDKSDDINSNLQRLTSYCTLFLEAINNSFKKFPL